MNNLPIASYLATELVRNRLRYGDKADIPAAAQPARHPVLRARLALAGGLTRVARMIGPVGYRPAH